ncbi:MAG: autotransporter domain-containing protein [Candidatus Krumholzibacteriota bacterium]|nr:autotransporter domain-containing protein [Candidatus Krumholzibacteriota bacterium]
MGTLTLGATYFPGNIGLYVRGGVGAAIGRSDVDEITATLLQVPGETTEFGPALLAAVGYEWRVTDRFAVGPQVEITYAAIDGDLIGEPLVVDGSIQFNWYW